jgi:uncharacterized coiled-coil DUF342 family protein
MHFKMGLQKRTDRNSIHWSKAKLPEDAKTVEGKVKELDRELVPLKEQRSKLESEAKLWMGRRDHIRRQIEQLRAEIVSLKTHRDEINQKVKDLKIIRDQLVSDRKDKLNRVIEFKQKVASVKQDPVKAILAVKKEIENLDWRIQTNSLTMSEEKRMVQQIAELERRLVSYKQTQAMWSEIKTSQQQLRDLRTEEKEFHGQIAQLAEQSRQAHRMLIEEGANIPKLKTEANVSHQKYIDTRKQVQKLDQQCELLTAQIRLALSKSKSEEEKKKAKRETKLMQELEEKALGKMKRGEKLTWDEFKVLAEKGLTGS